MKSFDSYRKWKYTKFLSNKNYSFNRNYILNIISSKIITDAFNSISKWKYYKKTPLLKLEKLSKNLKSNKDASYRILAQIASSVPKRVKFDAVEYNGIDQVIIHGVAANDKDILKLITNLGKKKMIKQASLASMNLPRTSGTGQVLKGFKIFVRVEG